MLADTCNHFAIGFNQVIMTKREAINIISDYMNKKPFNWESIPIVDNEPIEKKFFWVFKNYWGPRDALRGNRVFVDHFTPYIVLSKRDNQIKEISSNSIDIISTLE